MKSIYLSTFLSFLFIANVACAAAPSLSILPEKIIQGDPVMVIVSGVRDISEVQKVIFDGKSVPFFLYNSKPTAFVPIDLNKKIGDYSLTITLLSGVKLTQAITVGVHPKIDESLGIPESMGGNTRAGAKNLVSGLADENGIINGLFSNPKKLWTDKFIFPVSDPVVTDTYGYDRQSSGYSIAHKGTDFHAIVGTPVHSMERGVVRLVRDFPSYGKTIIIDHGIGMKTMYMHLSDFKVKEGQLVSRGQLIGLSGQTGYALGAHLHVSVRVGNISIDPMVFMGFFK